MTVLPPPSPLLTTKYNVYLFVLFDLFVRLTHQKVLYHTISVPRRFYRSGDYISLPCLLLYLNLKGRCFVLLLASGDL